MITNLTINIKEEGLNKFDFIKKIEDVMEKWNEGDISARIITTDEYESKKYISFNFRIKEYEEYYYYNFYYISNDSQYDGLYDYSANISKKEIVKLYNYLARDIDVIIKIYKEINE